MKINERQLRAIIREAIEDELGQEGGDIRSKAQEVAEMFGLDGGVTTVSANGQEEVRLFGSSFAVESLFRDNQARRELRNYMQISYFCIGDHSNTMGNRSFVQGILL